MNAYGYTFLGLTALVAALVGVLVFALLRFLAAARATRDHAGPDRTEAFLLSSALQDAVSTLKEKERAMSARAVASERLSAQVFNSLTAGLLVVDADGGVRIANPAAERMLGVPLADLKVRRYGDGSDLNVRRHSDGSDLNVRGYTDGWTVSSTASTITGEHYRDVLGADHPFVDVVAEGLTSQAPIVRRSLRVESGGRTWHFGVTVSPLGDPVSQHGVICLFSDLTAVVELEEQLHLKDALARVGELTAGIAHEFRNGLATIHGYSRLLDPKALPPKYGPYVEGIRQETDALGKVVTNFLRFARPEEVSLSSVDAGSLVRRTVDDLRLELSDEVAISVDGEFAPIQGDEVLLRNVFSNLVRNGIEACEIAARPAAVRIEGRIHAGMQLVAVEDDGPGVPHKDRARIFQPFFTTRSRGSGLGLAIVQKIVLLHNGRVTVSEARGGGARFELTFPLSRV